MQGQRQKVSSCIRASEAIAEEKARQSLARKRQEMNMAERIQLAKMFRVGQRVSVEGMPNLIGKVTYIDLGTANVRIAFPRGRPKPFNVTVVNPVD